MATFFNLKSESPRPANYSHEMKVYPMILTVSALLFGLGK